MLDSAQSSFRSLFEKRKTGLRAVKPVETQPLSDLVDYEKIVPGGVGTSGCRGVTDARGSRCGRDLQTGLVQASLCEKYSVQTVSPTAAAEPRP